MKTHEFHSIFLPGQNTEKNRYLKLVSWLVLLVLRSGPHCLVLSFGTCSVFGFSSSSRQALVQTCGPFPLQVHWRLTDPTMAQWIHSTRRFLEKTKWSGYYYSWVFPSQRKWYWNPRARNTFPDYLRNKRGIAFRPKNRVLTSFRR